MLLVRVPDTARYGRVTLDDKGALVAFTEKGDATGPGWINAGAYVLPRAVIESISPGCAVSLERDVLPLLVGRGLFGFDTDGPFLDIGTPESYAAAEQFFASVATRE
jgi:D-glycero-alpha-D-manno-heptose 1-phosphate guanylyltransferase